MSNRNHKWNVSYGLAALVFAVAPAFANPIFVNNFSFETLPLSGLNLSCGSGCNYSVAAIPGWTSVGSASGQFKPGNPGNTTYFNSVSVGPTDAFSNGGIISQVVAATVQPGQVYTLHVDLGWRKDWAFTGSADLRIGASALYNATGVAVKGTFTTFTAVYIGTLADAGKSITIELRSSGTQANFDNVLLDQNTPEPASFLLIGSGVLLLGLGTLRRRRAGPKTDV